MTNEILENPWPVPGYAHIGTIVTAIGRGGEVKTMMEYGVVVGFNRTGFPIVEITNRDGTPTAYYGAGKRVVDRYGVFRVVTPKEGSNVL